MSQALSLLLLAQNEGRKRGLAHPCLIPLLGKTSLELVSLLALKFEPEKKVLLGQDLGEYREKFKLLGWEIFEFETNRNQNEYYDLLFKAFPKNKSGDLLIIDSSFPLLRKQSLQSLFKEHRLQGAALSFLSLGACEANESKTKKKVKGSIFSDGAALIFRKEALAGLDREILSSGIWAQGLEAIITWLKRENERIIQLPLRAEENLNVRNGDDRLKIIGFLRQKKIDDLMKKGVIFLDLDSIWIDLGVSIGAKTIISPAVVIEGNSRLGREVKVYPFVHIIDSRIGNRTQILSSTMIEGSYLEDEVKVGPFAHLRPGTMVKAGARIGNFVEIKKTVFGRSSKAMHLSYLGDSLVGDEVNIGAGTITCNFDGRKKHQTVIEDGAFIGSGTELVAPVKVGKGAYIGAGSTITKNVSPDALAIARARQVEIPEWTKRRRNK